MSRAEPYPGTQAIRRALGLLTAFTEARPEWSLAELTKAKGLNKTTAYRALAALESEGLVQRTGSGTYRLGPTVITLGYRAVRTNDLRTVSRPELVALAEETGESATLEVAVGGEVLILDEVHGPGLVGMRGEIGTRWPLHATSTGKAMLAVAETLGERDSESALRLPDALAALTPRTVTTHKELEAALARIRKDGYAVANEELQPGSVAVGAAILNHEGRPVAALGIGGPSNRLGMERLPALGAMVRARAARVSMRLGAPAEPSGTGRRDEAGGS